MVQPSHSSSSPAATDAVQFEAPGYKRSHRTLVWVSLLVVFLLSAGVTYGGARYASQQYALLEDRQLEQQKQLDDFKKSATIGELSVRNLTGEMATLRHLSVTGSATLESLLAQAATISQLWVAGDQITSGNGTIEGSLIVRGAITTSELEVTGNTTLAGLISSGQLRLTGDSDDLLLIQPTENNGQHVVALRTPSGEERATLDASGNLRLGGDATIIGALNVSGNASFGFMTAQSANLTNATIGTLTVTQPAVFTGTPVGALVNQGVIYLNPANANPTDTLLGLAVAGVQKLRVDASGNIYANNMVLSGSVTTGDTTVNNLTVLNTTTLGGTLSVTGATTSASSIQGTQLISTVATGTAPLTVASTTKVTNLNVDLLDGLDSTAFAPSSGSGNYIQNGTLVQTANFNISGSGYFGGDVGIGTTSPSTKLDIRNTSFQQLKMTNTFSSQQLWQGSVADTVGSFIGNNAYYSASFQYMPNYTAASGINFRQDGSTEFWNDTGLTPGTVYNPTERVAITNTGNFGIGTVTPSAKLHSISTSAANARFDISSLSTGVAATAAVEIRNTDSTVNNSSELIGRNSLGGFTAGIGFINQVHGSNPTSTGAIRFVTNNAGTIAERVRISSDGNLGIGTTTPGVYRLNVQGGDANFSGNLIAGATISGTQLISTVATGTAPLTVASTTKVTNLNVDLLDGLDSTAFATATGSGNYIQNGTAIQTANFAVQSAAAGSVGAVIRGAASQTADLMQWQNSAGVSLTKIDVNGRLVLGGSIDGKIQFVRSGGNTFSIEHDASRLYFYNSTSSAYGLAIQNNGNVGIGTVAPTSKLQVAAGSIAIDAGQSINLNGGATGSGRYSMGATGGELRLYAGSDTERFVINASTGYVGIGTTTPAERLQVAGGSVLLDNNTSLKFKDSGGIASTILTVSTANNVALVTPTAGGSLQLSVANATGAMQFLTNGTEKMRLTNGGNLGIGTVSPSGLLHTYSADNTTYFETSGTRADIEYKSPAQRWRVGLNADGGATNSWIVRDVTGGINAALVVKQGGNVGIGAASPTSLLHVAGSQPVIVATNGTAATQVLQVTGGKGGDTSGITGQVAGTGAAANITAGAGGDAAAGSTNGNGGVITLQGGAPGVGLGTAGSYGSIVLQASGGNVGIGTASPQTNLHISSTDTYLTLSDSDASANTKHFYLRSSSGRLAIGSKNDSYANSTEAVTILPGGTVGIGTLTPGYSLDIKPAAGNAAFNIQNSSGANLLTLTGSSPALVMSTTGYGIFYGSVVTNVRMGSTADSPGSVALLARGITGQTADILQVRDNATNNTVLMNVTASGNLGVGTATPGQKLDIQGGNINTSGLLMTGGTQRLNASGALSNITSADISSYVAIGTNPSTGGAVRLANNQGIYNRNAANTADIIAIRVGNDNLTYVGNGALVTSSGGGTTSVFIANNNGNVAIGNGAVAGSAKFLVKNAVAGQAVQVIQGAAGQTSDILQAQDSTGAVLASISSTGNLSVKDAIINGTLTVNGHIVTGGPTTTIAAGAGAGTAPTVSITGNDTSGVITVTTGTTPSAGVLATITFGSAYGATPRVVLTPANGNGSTLQYYYNATTGSFTLNANNTPVAGTTYTYSYHVEQ